MGQFSLEPRAFPLCAASPQCPAVDRARCRCLYDHLAVQAQDDPTATSHLLAMLDSRAVVERARPELTDRAEALVAAHGNAGAALRRLSAYLMQESIVAARHRQEQVEARHAADGAFDRRRRLLPGRWTAETLIALAAVFDTVFFGTLFRFLVDADTSTPWGRVHAMLAYIPGVVLAAALLLAGIWLAEAVECWRIRRAAWPDAEDAPRPEWVLPGLLLVLVLSTVAAAAWARGGFLEALARAARGLQGNGASPNDLFPSWVIVLLIVMLSVTAIAAKVASRNSFADSAAESAAQLQAARESYDGLLAGAERALTRFEQRWIGLQDAISAVISDVEDLWATAWHHSGGDDLPQQAPAGPGGEESRFWRLVRHSPSPPPAFGPLLSAGHVLSSHSPEEARSTLRELVATAERQWAPMPIEEE